mgnify:CR=1 FL=1
MGENMKNLNATQLKLALVVGFGISGTITVLAVIIASLSYGISALFGFHTGMPVNLSVVTCAVIAFGSLIWGTLESYKKM